MTNKYQSYAFFDVDNTLINIKSMFSFLEFYEKYSDIQHQIKKSEKAHFLELAKNNSNRNLTNKAYYQLFKGVPATHFYQCAQLWSADLINTLDSLLLESTVQQLNEHKKSGVGIVFVSGSFPELLEPIIKKLGADACLATQIVQENGVITGEIKPPQTIGDGKALAVQAFLKSHKVSAEQCYAYGDDISDAPMLHAVGSATIIIGNEHLEAEAKKHQWKILQAKN
ncbi:hypothetical protein BGP78_13770 [Pseudoalteromonas sp. MSK9-3]|uniref:HAD family hydrolase n=1 Tax=Pseudoalteromonas sp. MSK9-3 TaxID=1897633 RepID=UPI000E6CEFBB|nr:HAD-IB family hydrolase [Pseudoalteromonas sp. MSK9-3]RJE76077.1 hypothetical protein BGP78_13770 [Pseudoalteromonas sp. MSK9-3]